MLVVVKNPGFLSEVSLVEVKNFVVPFKATNPVDAFFERHGTKR